MRGSSDARRCIDEFLARGGPTRRQARLLARATAAEPRRSITTSPQAFFTALRERTKLPVACEAREPSWFTTQAAALLKANHIAYVDADPIPDECEIKHRADTSLVYVRLHGSPELYKSSYDYTYLDDLARTLHTAREKDGRSLVHLRQHRRGPAQPNALHLMERLRLHHKGLTTFDSSTEDNPMRRWQTNRPFAWRHDARVAVRPRAARSRPRMPRRRPAPRPPATAPFS